MEILVGSRLYYTHTECPAVKCYTSFKDSSFLAEAAVLVVSLVLVGCVTAAISLSGSLTP